MAHGIIQKSNQRHHGSGLRKVNNIALDRLQSTHALYTLNT